MGQQSGFTVAESFRHRELLHGARFVLIKHRTARDPSTIFLGATVVAEIDLKTDKAHENSAPAVSKIHRSSRFNSFLSCHCRSPESQISLCRHVCMEGTSYELPSMIFKYL